MSEVAAYDSGDAATSAFRLSLGVGEGHQGVPVQLPAELLEKTHRSMLMGGVPWLRHVLLLSPHWLPEQEAKTFGNKWLLRSVLNDL